jgi:hypothetical protein
MLSPMKKFFGKIFSTKIAKKKGEKREKTVQIFAEALPKSFRKNKFCGKSGSYFCN